MTKITVKYPLGVHDLLSTIVATMFADFQRDLHEPFKEVDHNHKRMLVKKFQSVMNDIKVVNNSYDTDNWTCAIEELSDKAKATLLDENFKELVKLGDYDVTVNIEDLFGIALTDNDRIDIRRVTRNWDIPVNIIEI